MCGICGIFGHPDPGATGRMVQAMHHRGPDDRGVYSDSNISFGMARLAVIDLKPTGHQPMSNHAQTIWIVYNGEVYNFIEQREHLEKMGESFVSTSDTEVIMRLYERYGDDFLLRLRGMFALAIYDKRKGPGREKLLLARDHLGIKPLLYAEKNGSLVFASELKALLAGGLVSREIDPAAFRLVLTFGSVYQPRTMLADVKALRPAHRMIVENGQKRIERYWSLGTDRVQGLKNAPYEDQVRAVREAVAESLKLQMVSDVPLGAFLSGGVDSSVLVSLMARELGGQVKTFSVGFDGEGTVVDESGEAARTAKFVGADHTHVIVKSADVRDRIRHIVAGLDQPTVDGVNSYFVSWAARKAVTVAISGTGGDEIFAGYPWFQAMQTDVLQPQSLWVRWGASLARMPLFDPLLSASKGERLYSLRNRSGFLSRYAMQYHIFNSRGAARLISPSLGNDAQIGTAEHFDLLSIDELPQADAIERVSALCLRGYTGNQLLRDIDVASMAHSLEVRVPYLDPVLTDLALSLPFASKSGAGDTSDPRLAGTYRYTGAKKILVDAGKDLLPPNFDIQPKRGFTMPFDSYLNGALKDTMLDALSESAVRRRGWLAVEEVGRIKNTYLAGRSSWVFPWLLMMTELWAREVLDQ